MRVPLKEKLAYGLADTANNLIIGTAASFLLYFYTEVFGLRAAAAGALLLGVRVADGLIDLMVGVAADRTRSRWGRFRPWLLWMAGPFSIFAVLAFSTPPWGSEAKLIYAWVVYLLLMTTFSAITVPLGALLAVMTDDTHERTTLGAIRIVFAGIGTMVVAVATLPLVKAFAGATGGVAQGYQRTLILYGVAAFALFMITFAVTRERVQPPVHQVPDLAADLSMLRRNGPWMVVTLTALLMVAVATLRGAVVLYYFDYYVGNASGATLFLTTISLGAIVGALISAPLARRLGKRTTFRSAAFLAAAASALVWPLGKDQPILLETLNLITSVAMGAMGPLSFSMLADTVDYGEWKCGRRSTGVIFSGLSFGYKLGMGLGGALTATLLVAFGYTAGQAQHAETVRGMAMMISIIPALGLFSIGLLTGFYSLDERKREGIRADLVARKEHSIAIGSEAIPGRP